MKKTFQLHAPGKEDSRVVAVVRSEVGKYINRAKRKPLPTTNDRWEFACRVGPDAATAVAHDWKQVPAAIDAVAASGADEVYIEILASAQPKPTPTPPPPPSIGESI